MTEQEHLQNEVPERETSPDGEYKPRGWLAIAGRPLEILVGVVFLAGALLKLTDINLFAIQIWAYGVLPAKTILPAVALATLTVETLLGGCLLLAFRMKGFSFAFVETLLAVFTGLILYGWLYHGLKDCGCFGPLEISPGLSIAKNALLAFGAGLAWMGTGMHSVRAGSNVWRAAVIVLAAVAASGYAFTTLEQTASGTPEGKVGPGVDPGPAAFAEFTVETPRGPIPLAQGTYIVAMLSMDCEHCMQEAPALNAFLSDLNLPETVALCYQENEGDLANFRSVTGLRVPMQVIGKLKYFMLIGEDNFRVYIVRDGRALHFWDGKAPTPETVTAFLDSIPAQ